MKYALGIDLGTTNSVVSVYRRGEVETILIEGSKILPSVVSFNDKNVMLVGHSAKRRLIIDPANSVGSVKRFMGDHKMKFNIKGTEYSPVQISSFILKKIAAEAEKQLGEKVKDVVITVPAYFTDAQKKDTKTAGELAGLNVLRLIPEPTSAAIAYGLDKGKDQTILVYDLGGGTFDVSILKVKGNEFDVLAVDGDLDLGGDNFDNAIVDYLLNKFKAKTGINLKNDRSREALIAKQKMKEAAEKAKLELSQAKDTEILIPDIMDHRIDEKLTRDQYNKLVKPYLDTTIAKIRSALEEAGLIAADIDRVILVGGSTRNTAVKELVAREIKEPYISERVDEEVSHGAAIMAAGLILPVEDSIPVEENYVPVRVSMKNRTAHSLGVELLYDDMKPFFKPIIQRNSYYPVSQGILAYTVRPFQESVLVEVFRGENKNCRSNEKLGQLILKIDSLSKDQIPVGLIFNLDEDGILYFSCAELSINRMEPDIYTAVREARENNGIIDIDNIQKLINRRLVKFEKIQITEALELK